MEAIRKRVHYNEKRRNNPFFNDNRKIRKIDETALLLIEVRHNLFFLKS